MDPYASTPLRLLVKSKLLLVGVVLTITFILFVVFFLFELARSNTPPSQSPNITHTGIPDPTLIPISQIPLKKRGEAQSQADKNYGDLWTNLYKQYPWASKLPIHTDHYFVYLDPNTKHLVAKIYPVSSSSVEVDSLKSTVTRTLTNLGVNTAQVIIDWKVASK